MHLRQNSAWCKSCGWLFLKPPFWVSKTSLYDRKTLIFCRFLPEIQQHSLVRQEMQSRDAVGYMDTADACFLDRAEIKFLQILDTLSHIRF
jgi:hypothetical protein